MTEEIKKDSGLSLEQLMRKKEIDEIAWRMLNIFRQFHIIEGGIEAVNKYFITADDDVISSIKEMPSGKKLAEHILNLKSGKTKMNSINEFLLPFGEDVFLDLPGGKPDIYDKEIDVKEGTPKAQDAEVKEVFADYKKTEMPKDVEVVLSGEKSGAKESDSKPKDVKPDQPEQEVVVKSPVPKVEIPEFSTASKTDKNNTEKSEITDLDEVIDMIKNFSPAPDKLEDFKSSKKILSIGQNWEITITEAINNSDVKDKESVLTKFRELTTYDKAVSVWSEAQDMLLNAGLVNKEDLKNRLPFFKEYLTMFGKSGEKLFNEINAIAEE